VGIAQDGGQAIAYLEGRHEFTDRQKFPYPDVLFLDLKMPRVTGFEVLDWLQRRASRPFIVVLSGSELETDVKRARALGADTYRVKPSTSEAYIAILRGIQDQIRLQHKAKAPRA
jgi:CheY-like chemotaxis protein